MANFRPEEVGIKRLVVSSQFTEVAYRVWTKNGAQPWYLFRTGYKSWDCDNLLYPLRTPTDISVVGVEFFTKNKRWFFLGKRVCVYKSPYDTSEQITTLITEEVGEEPDDDHEEEEALKSDLESFFKRLLGQNNETKPQKRTDAQKDTSVLTNDKGSKGDETLPFSFYWFDKAHWDYWNLEGYLSPSNCDVENNHVEIRYYEYTLHNLLLCNLLRNARITEDPNPKVHNLHPLIMNELQKLMGEEIVIDTVMGMMCNPLWESFKPEEDDLKVQGPHEQFYLRSYKITSPMLLQSETMIKRLDVSPPLEEAHRLLDIHEKPWKEKTFCVFKGRFFFEGGELWSKKKEEMFYKKVMLTQEYLKSIKIKNPEEVQKMLTDVIKEFFDAVPLYVSISERFEFYLRHALLPRGYLIISGVEYLENDEINLVNKWREKQLLY